MTFWLNRAARGYVGHWTTASLGRGPRQFGGDEFYVMDDFGDLSPMTASQSGDEGWDG